MLGKLILKYPMIIMQLSRLSVLKCKTLSMVAAICIAYHLYLLSTDLTPKQNV